MFVVIALSWAVWYAAPGSSAGPSKERDPVVAERVRVDDRAREILGERTGLAAHVREQPLDTRGTIAGRTREVADRDRVFPRLVLDREGVGRDRNLRPAADHLTDRGRVAEIGVRFLGRRGRYALCQSVDERRVVVERTPETCLGRVAEILIHLG